MGFMQKPRVLKEMEGMTPEALDELDRWLAEGVPYLKIAERSKGELGQPLKKSTVQRFVARGKATRECVADAPGEIEAGREVSRYAATGRAVFSEGTLYLFERRLNELALAGEEEDWGRIKELSAVLHQQRMGAVRERLAAVSEARAELKREEFAWRREHTPSVAAQRAEFKEREVALKERAQEREWKREDKAKLVQSEEQWEVDARVVRSLDAMMGRGRNDQGSGRNDQGSYPNDESRHQGPNPRNNTESTEGTEGTEEKKEHFRSVVSVSSVNSVSIPKPPVKNRKMDAGLRLIECLPSGVDRSIDPNDEETWPEFWHWLKFNPEPPGNQDALRHCREQRLRVITPMNVIPPHFFGCAPDANLYDTNYAENLRERRIPFLTEHPFTQEPLEEE